jgi:hypothetical protein
MAKIHSIIPDIISEIGAVDKTKVNQMQGNFKYRSVDDVMNALQPLLAKHRLFIVPEVLEQSREERTTRKDSLLIYSICKVKYTFYAEDGSSIEAIVVGEGMDGGDKSTSKALSMAFKYACTQVFCIATEDLGAYDRASNAGFLGRRSIVKSEGDTISIGQANHLLDLSGSNKSLCMKVINRYGYVNSRDVRKEHYNRICSEIATSAARN